MANEKSKDDILQDLHTAQTIIRENFDSIKHNEEVNKQLDHLLKIVLDAQLFISNNC